MTGVLDSITGPRTSPQQCVESFADVLSFAIGQKRSIEGKSIEDYAER